VAASGAAGFVGDSQIAGVQKADELGRFLVEGGVGAGRVCGGFPEGSISRGDVGGGEVGGLVVASVAGFASQGDGGGGMHRLDADVAFGRFATVGLRLAQGGQEKEQKRQARGPPY
jgi:hypothetical protein